MKMAAALLPSDCLRWATVACTLLLITYPSFMVVANDDESNPCLLYLAESTIPGGQLQQQLIMSFNCKLYLIHHIYPLNII